MSYPVTQNLEHICCYQCSVSFAMPSALLAYFRDNTSQCFTCPNGHRQYFTESESTRLKRDIEKLIAQHAQVQQRWREDMDRSRTNECQANMRCIRLARRLKRATKKLENKQ